MDIGEPVEVVEVEPEPLVPQAPEEDLEPATEPAEREQEEQPAESEPAPVT